MRQFIGSSIVRTRRKCEPPVLRVLADTRLLRLLGRRNGTTGILRADTDTEEEAEGIA